MQSFKKLFDVLSVEAPSRTQSPTGHEASINETVFPIPGSAMEDFMNGGGPEEWLKARGLYAETRSSEMCKKIICSENDLQAERAFTNSTLPDIRERASQYSDEFKAQCYQLSNNSNAGLSESDTYVVSSAQDCFYNDSGFTVQQLIDTLLNDYEIFEESFNQGMAWQAEDLEKLKAAMNELEPFLNRLLECGFLEKVVPTAGLSCP